MTVSIFIASLFLLFAQTGKGAIEGTVVSSTTNKPIPGAQVTVIRTGAAPVAGATTGVLGGVLGAAGAVLQLEGPGNRPSANTDSSGRFVLQDLEPGRYIVQAGAEGYARQQFGPPPQGQAGMSASADVSAGQASTGIVLHLVPGGNVSGRVTGTSGEPLVGMEVMLVRMSYGIGGQRNVSQTSNAQTNDKGEYRLFWVTPGRYYLSVSPSSRPVGASPFMPSNANNKYPRTFYPGVSNVDSATEVDIPPGGEVNGIDFRLVEQRVYRIRGRVVDSVTGQVPRTASISLTPRESIGPISGMAFPLGNAYNPADGTFELRDVQPGSYWVRAQLPFPPGARPVSPAGPIRPQVAIAPVEVHGNDVDNVVLTVLPPINISGRVRVEGTSTPALDRLRITLQPAPGTLMLGPTQPAVVNADGTFQMENISPGDYQLAVPGLGPVPNGTGTGAGLYLKEARLGAADVLIEPLTILGSVSGELQIVLSSNAGEVTGSVTDAGEQGASRIQIVLVPERRERRDLYKMGTTDASGHFTVRSVPPGNYRLFAVDPSDMTSFFDPAMMRKFEPGAKPVSIGGSTTVNVDLRLIRPAR